MAEPINKVVVFVHGWSVYDTKTYGNLPKRLQAQGKDEMFNIIVKEIFLGEYVSFRDVVRLDDISQGFQAAVERELRDLIKQYGRFACITHSTGAPVVRDWWNRFYLNNPQSGQCPLSHLIMLAPANFGSALAQLGKGTLGRMKALFEGIEPGTGVLNWLELGSHEAWELNTAWIQSNPNQVIGAKSKTIFPFVLTGQTIDSKFYDHVNSYTGEAGSDGVVRVASANLNSVYVRLEQEKPTLAPNSKKKYEAKNLHVKEGPVPSPQTAFCVVPNASHTGTKIGIMRSVAAQKNAVQGAFVVKRILECLKVQTSKDYKELRDGYEQLTRQVQEQEVENCHSRYSMLIFRLRDSKGYPIEDFDLLLTAGKNFSPDKLPKGFFADRQKNKLNPNTLTYYINYDIMAGCESQTVKGKVVRNASEGANYLGLKIVPRPSGDDVVYFLPCELKIGKDEDQTGITTKDLLQHLQPNQTMLIDIVLQRVVHESVFQMTKGTKTRSFRTQWKKDPGPPL